MRFIIRFFVKLKREWEMKPLSPMIFIMSRNLFWDINFKGYLQPINYQN